MPYTKTIVELEAELSADIKALEALPDTGEIVTSTEEELMYNINLVSCLISKFKGSESSELERENIPF